MVCVIKFQFVIDVCYLQAGVGDERVLRESRFKKRYMLTCIKKLIAFEGTFYVREC